MYIGTIIEKLDIVISSLNLADKNMRKLILILFTFIIFSLGFLVSSQIIAQQPPAVFPVEVQAEAIKGGYQLIDMTQLWQLYQQDEQNLFLVDTRQDWEYHSGHIKNALNFPMAPTWLARLTQRGPLEQFLGQDKSKTIVFY